MSPFCVAEAACFSQNEQKLTLETPRCSQKEIELTFFLVKKYYCMTRNNVGWSRCHGHGMVT